MSFSGARPMRTVVADSRRATLGSRSGGAWPSPLTVQPSTGPSVGLPSRAWHSPSISIRSTRWPRA